MPRLDAHRLNAWRDLNAVVDEVARRIDDDLRTEWAVPLGSFEVLDSLRRLNGRARPQDLAQEMRLPPSSLSRRIDRLEEEGWVARHRAIDPADHRAVDVELTVRGRTLWREMNVTYRRSVQHHFARWLADERIDAVVEVVDLLGTSLSEPDDLA